ncbi:MAG: ChbG/HpnK family deacetylase [Trueperaceae bacterium]|nr:ChbG/HpnK family deacetylase [Trueperaceae bacterium]
MTKTLIVNADDLGMSEAVTRGILDAHRNGIVTSSSAMMNGPHARAGLETALRDAPELGLGLHLTLTWGRPVLPPERIPSLVGAHGGFVSVPRGMALPGNWSRKDIAAELRAQLDRFVEIAGRPPDHVDAHHGITTYAAPVREVMLEIASEHGIAVRRTRAGWFARMERIMPTAADLPDEWGPWLDRVPTPWRRGPMGERTPLSTDGLDFRFFGERATVEQLLRILGTLPGGVTELMCHPGSASGGDDYAFREAELAALTDPRVKAKVEEAGIELASFAVLTKLPARD